MRLATTLLVVLVGCGGRGIDLEIHTDQITADTVEVFLAAEPCHDMSGAKCTDRLSWLAAGPALPVDNLYLLDHEQRTIAPVVNHQAVVHLTASEDTRLDRAVIVGYQRDGTGQDHPTGMQVLEDVTVLASEPQIWRVDLVPADDVRTDKTPPAPGANTSRVHLWRPTVPPPGSTTPATELAACLATERWDNGAPHREFYGPPEDPDCDNHTKVDECDAYWFDFAESAATHECVVQGPVKPTVCTVGTRACVDGTPQTDACGQIAKPLTCLPSTLCGGDCPASFDSTCLADQLGTTMAALAAPSVTCAFASEPTSGSPCTSNSNDIDVITLPPSVGVVCDAVSVREIATPLGGPIAQPFPVGAHGGTFEVMLVNPTAGCSASVRFRGLADLNVLPRDVFLDFHVATLDRDILIPLRVGWADSGVSCPLQHTPACQPTYTGPNGGLKDSLFDCLVGN